MWPFLKSPRFAISSKLRHEQDDSLEVIPISCHSKHELSFALVGLPVENATSLMVAVTSICIVVPKATTNFIASIVWFMVARVHFPTV